MNTFQIEFQPSAAAQAAAVKQGRLLSRTITIAVDPAELKPAERELILKLGIPTAGQTLKMSSYENPDGEDLAAVLAYLQQREVQRAEKEAEEKETAEKRRQQRQANARAYLAGGTWLYETSDTGIPELDAAVDAEIARRKEVEAAEKAAEKAAHEKAVEELKQWALKHGSAHLKDLISEGFNWQAVARSEWIEVNTPEGFFNVGDEDGFDEWYAVKNPSPRAIQVLRETRKTNPTARLMRVKFYDGRHDDYVSIEIQPPVGESVSRELFIENYSNNED